MSYVQKFGLQCCFKVLLKWIMMFHIHIWLNCFSSAAEKTTQVSGEAKSYQSAEEERGDLIQFYNSIFILKVKSFALRYSTNDNGVCCSHAETAVRCKLSLMTKITNLTLCNPPGRCPSSFSIPFSSSSPSLSSPCFSETLTVCFPTQELCRKPHTKLLHL